MRKEWLKRVVFIFLILFGIIAILNVKVTTREGINYQWQTIEIPLYLKVLDFFDRHYNYKWLVKKITDNSKQEEEKVLKIFEWTHKNIKKVPEGYPVIDDHVWHIIVRGYGADDQSSDVFTTLCNYAGVDAFFSWVYVKDRSSRIPLSFVKVNERWNVFDPYNGVYFKNREKGLASIEDISKGDWLVEGVDNIKKPDIDYTMYLKNLPSLKEIGLKRANIQSPINRLRYEIKKWLQ